MQKWEYCTVLKIVQPSQFILFTGEGDNVQQEARQNSASMDPTSQAMEVQKFLATMGNEGWELVGGDGTRLFFRRGAE